MLIPPYQHISGCVIASCTESRVRGRCSGSNAHTTFSTHVVRMHHRRLQRKEGQGQMLGVKCSYHLFYTCCPDASSPAAKKGGSGADARGQMLIPPFLHMSGCVIASCIRSKAMLFQHHQTASIALHSPSVLDPRMCFKTRFLPSTVTSVHRAFGWWQEPTNCESS
jgi:hypothetical protein